jgi:hypothetical protein
MAVAIEAALRRASALVLVAISLAVPIAALSLQLARPLAAPRLGLAPGHFPERGLAFICDLPEPLALRGRVFNEFAYGGLVIFSLWPSQQVYIDGRTDLVYPPAAVRTYLAAMNDAAAFEREAAKYGIEWVFLDNAPQKKSRLHFDRNPQWALVHASQRALIYVRRGGINGALVEEHAYQLLEAHALLPSLQRALAGGRGAEALVELQRMRREDPDNVYAAMALIELERRVRSH